MARRIIELPRGLKPLGVDRETAAALIGVGGSTFDNMVADGRMPQPIRIGSRRVWNRAAVEKAFFALDGYTPPQPADPMDDWADYQ